jgi:membrane protein implicated in regulation of membrane protease activity
MRRIVFSGTFLVVWAIFEVLERAGMPRFAFALYIVSLLTLSVLSAVFPRRFRSFLLKGTNVESLSKYRRHMLSERISIPSMRLGGIIGIAMAVVALWASINSGLRA